MIESIIPARHRRNAHERCARHSTPVISLLKLRPGAPQYISISILSAVLRRIVHSAVRGVIGPSLRTRAQKLADYGRHRITVWIISPTAQKNTLESKFLYLDCETTCMANLTPILHRPVHMFVFCILAFLPDGFPCSFPEVPQALFELSVFGLLLYRCPTFVLCVKRFRRTPLLPRERLHLISHVQHHVCERGLVGIRFQEMRQCFLITKLRCWVW